MGAQFPCTRWIDCAWIAHTHWVERIHGLHTSNWDKRMTFRKNTLLAVCSVALMICIACAPAEQETAVEADAGVAEGGAEGTAASPSEVDPSSPNARYYTPDGLEAAMSAFEEDDRETWQHSAEILAALALEPGMTVADVGAGTGYFTRQIAPMIEPGGVVLAVDIIPEFLEDLERRVQEAGLTNIETVLSRPDDPMLPPDSVDLIFISDTYHHFDQPVAMLEGMRDALRAGGRMAIVDWERMPNPIFERDGLDWESHISVGSEDVIAQATQHGFRLLKQHDFLEWQYFLVFERR
jgi:ubiquinone/menaquinone biosynthesis C-methylase UbiE